MEVRFHANMHEEYFDRIARVLRSAFEKIAKDLSKDFGGTIKHLWIDFELMPSHAFRRPPFAFRFQKRVGTKKFFLTGLPTGYDENVGHYSVRPDFQKLLTMPLESVASYALGLIYESTSVLIAKQKKLGGFDAHKFRSEFLATCRAHGYEVTPREDAS